MKSKRHISFLVILLAICRPIQAQTNGTNFFPLLTTRARTFTNATLSDFNPVYAIIVYDGGGGRIALSNLSEALQQQYGYDPAKAAKYLDDENQRQKERQAATKAAAKKAGPVALRNAVKDQIDCTLDPFRETLTWAPKQNILISPHFAVGFLAVLIQGDFALKTNASGVQPQPLRTPEFVMMTLDSRSEDWEFLHFHDFIIVYDGKKKDFGELKHDGDVFAGGVSEHFFPEFTYSEFRDLAMAKSVKAVLGSFQFELSYKDRDSMRTFVNYLDHEVKSDTNGFAPTLTT